VANKRLIIEAVLVVAAFLLGYVPQYISSRRLETEVKTLRDQQAGAELRDLAAMALVQAEQKNYGLAAATAGRLFETARKNNVTAVMASRDKVTAELAKGDPAAVADLQDVYLKLPR
jgi:hypothetical protein